MLNRHGLATGLALSFVLVLSGSAMAAHSLSRSPNVNLEPSGGAALLPPGPASITQSTNAATITAGSSGSCNVGAPSFFHAENSYFRAFTLSAFNPPLDSVQFVIQNVTVGVEQATGASGSQPVTLRLFDSSANPPTNAAIGTAIATEAVTVPNQTLSLLSIPVTAPPVLLNASDILAVEIFTPTGVPPANNTFFIGSNSLGQSGPGFLRAPGAAGCNIDEITNLAAVGLANMHIVMTVSGNNQVPVELQTFEIR